MGQGCAGGMVKDPHIGDPEFGWQDRRTPASGRFGETYYSADGGLEESRLVFLKGCGLPEAWQGRRRFTIGETGFGTGLNFLAAWDLWRRSGPPDAVLHYMSVEGYPLAHAELAEALAPWSQLSPLASELLQALPAPLTNGFHRVTFGTDRVFLTLLVGEVGDMLETADANVDAWFLDGFSPARNPEMWRDEVLRHVARLSAPGAFLASYSVAGTVRRGLSSVGFNVEKKPGFGRKRDRLVARYEGAASPSRRPAWAPPQTLLDARRIGIIGAGIAGANLAAALRARGVQVVVVDGAPRAPAASGNPVAAIMPKVDLGSDAASEFSRLAYRHAVRTLPQDAVVSRGAVSLARTDKEADRFQRFASRVAGCAWAGSERVSAMAGLPLAHSGLISQDARTVTPIPLVDWLLSGSDLIQLSLGSDSIDGSVISALYAADQALDAIVIAAGAITPDILRAFLGETSAAELPMFQTPGQLSAAPETEISRDQRCVVSFGGYITPPIAGLHYVGATYEHNVTETPDQAGTLPLTAEGHARNWAALTEMLPLWSGTADPGPAGGRRSIRATTPDRLPILGPVGRDNGVWNVTQHTQHDAPHRGQRQNIPLYVATGLGSRGFTTSGLLAEILCAEWFQEPCPVPLPAALAVHPNRFEHRRLRRTQDRR